LFAERARIAIDEISRAVDQLNQEKSQAVGTVRALMSSPVGRGCIIPLLPRFQERYPKVGLEIELHDGPPDLMEHGFDIAVTDWVAVSDAYVSRPLCTLPIVTVASPGYLRSRGTPESVEELAGRECINVRLPSGELPCWRFVPDPGRGKSPRQRPRNAFSFTSKGQLLMLTQYDAVIATAIADLGITLAYAHAIQRHLENGDLKVLLPDYRIEPGSVASNRYHIRYANRRDVPMAQRVFVDFLLEQFRRKEYLQFERHRYAA
jgi:DNA-binding transcriptional LysR family regulator